MKTKLLAITAAICAAAALLSFTACGDGNESENSGKIEHGYSICYAFTAEDSLMPAGTPSMYDYMRALKDNDMLDFESSESDYGAFIISVMGVSTRTVSESYSDDFAHGSWKGYSWMVYTTVTLYDGTPYADTDISFEYNGVTLYQSAYGVSGIPCVKGESYALVYEYSETSF